MSSKKLPLQRSKWTQAFLLVLFTFSQIAIPASLSWAHGEDKPGPHQGFIKMPGAFHTEVVKTSDQGIKVYLLDMDWKNPTIKESSVTVSLKSKTHNEKATCKETDGNHYSCQFGSKVNLTQTGELIIEAVRERQKGNKAVYALPLKLPKEDPHAGHH